MSRKPLRIRTLPVLLVLCVPMAHAQDLGDAPKAARRSRHFFVSLKASRIACARYTIG